MGEQENVERSLESGWYDRQLYAQWARCLAENARLREALRKILGWRENDYDGQDRGTFAIEYMEGISREALEGGKDARG